jgi:hypothetical protein
MSNRATDALLAALMGVSYIVVGVLVYCAVCRIKHWRP